MSLRDQWLLCLDTICSGQFTLPTYTRLMGGGGGGGLSPAHILKYEFFEYFAFSAMGQMHV